MLSIIADMKDVSTILLEEFKMAKDIHIVFQVLNFLKSDHYFATITNANEQRLLIFLASHKGEKGIFPSIPLLAKELKIEKRSVMRLIKRWVELGVIEVAENPGKNNHYLLYIPEATPDTAVTPVIEKVIHTPDRCVTPPVTDVSVTRDRRVHSNNKEELSNNKELLYGKSVDNSKRHDFADSMDQMANEDRHIREHEERKQVEKFSPMPEDFREMINNLRRFR